MTKKSVDKNSIKRLESSELWKLRDQGPWYSACHCKECKSIPQALFYIYVYNVNTHTRNSYVHWYKPCILKCNLNIQLYVHICIESGMKIILALIVTAFTTFATTKRHNSITDSRPFYLLTMQKWFHYAMSEAVGRILWRWLRAFSAGTSCF